MNQLVAYLPIDRAHAIAQKRTLPDRTHGAALFCDISGFTVLTKELVAELGHQRGAEELTHYLNLVYDAIIAELHTYGGSVITFAGDAITCWLDGDDGLRATACALAMQAAMRQFSAVRIPGGREVPLGLKAAVACGPVRRFVVGDAQTRLIDIIAGQTTFTLAVAEHQAQRGEVILDPAAIAAVGDFVHVLEWREARLHGRWARFAVVDRLCPAISAAAHPSFRRKEVATQPWPPLPEEALTAEQLRPWLLPAVYGRLQRGLGQFLAELRPAVALFLCFDGIDYDGDDQASAKLDAYVRWVLGVVGRYGGTLLGLNIGDKGSCISIAFGALRQHEDDPVRATGAALELSNPPAHLAYITPVKIGISQGQMRAGAYGGKKRLTYSVLGDEVNMAARIMQAAPPGQIWARDSIQQASADQFVWEALPPISVKGSSEPMPVFRLRAAQRYGVKSPEMPAAILPLIGRQAEIAHFVQSLDQVLGGKGQGITLSGEAGIGKTRLMQELIELAQARGMTVQRGECSSLGTHSSYLVWQPIWRTLFGLTPSQERQEQIATLTRRLGQIDPELVQRLPLLGSLLDLPIADNELTRGFDAKVRKGSLEALLVRCLRDFARQSPLLLVLENCQWIDALSHDLALALGRTLADLPVLLVLTHRPLSAARTASEQISKLKGVSGISLAALDPAEAQALIEAKLHQLGLRTVTLPALLKRRIVEQAQGNPFYLNELVNYVGANWAQMQSAGEVDIALPTSLHTLVLARLDRLNERQKTLVKIASVFGRIFRREWLASVQPELGDVTTVLADVAALQGTEWNLLQPVVTHRLGEADELAYAFTQQITQSVAYESLPFVMRQQLHGQIGCYLETLTGVTMGMTGGVTQGLADQNIYDLLAHHFYLSNHAMKKIEYLRKAGEAAQAEYANDAAIAYYRKLLPLLEEPEQAAERVTILRKLASVLQLVGKWEEAVALYQQALDLAVALNDQATCAWCQTALGDLLTKRGKYAEASQWLEQAYSTFAEIENQSGLGQVLHYQGTGQAQQGDYAQARQLYSQSLTLRRALDDQPNIANLLSNLGILARFQGDYAAARALHEEALVIRRRLGDKWSISVSLNNLGNVALDQGKMDDARTWLEEAVALQQIVGDRAMLALFLNTLGNVTRDLGDLTSAAAHYRAAMLINREMDSKWNLAFLLEDWGQLVARQGDVARAFRLVGAAAALRQTTGARLSPTEQAKVEAAFAPLRQALGEAQAASLIEEGQAMSAVEALEYALNA